MICEQRFLEEIVGRCHQVYDRFMTASMGGNLSLRLPEGDRFLIKSTGRNLGEVTERDFVVVDAEGNTLAGEGKPSKEVFMHLGIYRVRPDVGAVVHHHGPNCVAFACHGATIPLVTITGQNALGPRIPVVPHAQSGSRELATYTTAAFIDPAVKVAVLSDHGVIVGGPDLNMAYNWADLIEDQARVAIKYFQLQALRQVGVWEPARY